MTQNPSPQGIVLSYHSNFFTVKVEAVEYQCFVKGLLKKEGTDVLVGDRVTIDSLDASNLSGRITGVLPRQNQLTRPKVSNIDQALIVASVQSPELDLEQVDRFITHVQLAGVEPALCISKIDLADSPESIAQVKLLYTALEIPVYTTSIKDDNSVNTLFSALNGKTVVLAGMSGVGKSSLINAASPQQNLAVGEVSEKIQRGQHTTRHAALIELSEATYIVDTPGFSYLKFDTVSPQALEAIYPDFAPLREQCRFQNCLHVDEADCAVKANLDSLSQTRYAHYLVFQAEAQSYVELQQTTSQKQEYGYKTLKKGKNEALHILKLKEKQREASRRKQKQQITLGLDDDGDTLDES